MQHAVGACCGAVFDSTFSAPAVGEDMKSGRFGVPSRSQHTIATLKSTCIRMQYGGELFPTLRP